MDDVSLCEKLRRQFKDKEVDDNILCNRDQILSEIQKAAPTQSVTSGYKTSVVDAATRSLDFFL